MPEILETQLRAILSVRPVGQCRIMIPMVASVDEIPAVRAVVERLRGELGIFEPVEVGIMVETPAAAVTSATLAAHADFLSIGTNDLTQYVLAASRDSGALSALARTDDPSVMALISNVAAHGAETGISVGLCGDAASDPALVPLLVKAGLRSLSVAASRIGAVKAAISGIELRTGNA